MSVCVVSVCRGVDATHFKHLYLNNEEIVRYVLITISEKSSLDCKGYKNVCRYVGILYCVMIGTDTLYVAMLTVHST